MSDPKEDLIAAMHKVREQDEAWRGAYRSYQEAQRGYRDRLILLGLRARMPVTGIALHLGCTPKSVMSSYRRLGLSGGRRNNYLPLADAAAKALERNSEVLGVRPDEISLMSPLAYLPVGDDLAVEEAKKAVVKGKKSSRKSEKQSAQEALEHLTDKQKLEVLMEDL